MIFIRLNNFTLSILRLHEMIKILVGANLRVRALLANNSRIRPLIIKQKVIIYYLTSLLMGSPPL